jgi:hypothetical protein
LPLALGLGLLFGCSHKIKVERCVGTHMSVYDEGPDAFDPTKNQIGRMRDRSRVKAEAQQFCRKAARAS